MLPCKAACPHLNHHAPQPGHNGDGSEQRGGGNVVIPRHEQAAVFAADAHKIEEQADEQQGNRKMHDHRVLRRGTGTAAFEWPRGRGGCRSCLTRQRQARQSALRWQAARRQARVSRSEVFAAAFRRPAYRTVRWQAAFSYRPVAAAPFWRECFPGFSRAWACSVRRSGDSAEFCLYSSRRQGGFSGCLSCVVGLSFAGGAGLVRRGSGLAVRIAGKRVCHEFRRVRRAVAVGIFAFNGLQDFRRQGLCFGGIERGPDICAIRVELGRASGVAHVAARSVEFAAVFERIKFLRHLQKGRQGVGPFRNHRQKCRDSDKQEKEMSNECPDADAKGKAHEFVSRSSNNAAKRHGGTASPI